MIEETDVYKIGTLTRTHGVKGEMAFQFTDDVWDRIEADYVFCRMDGLLVPFFFEEWRFRSDTTALVKFEGIDNANAAQTLVGAEVFFPKELTPGEVDDEELTWRHFTGFVVFQTDDTGTVEKKLGIVSDVLDQTANTLLDVQTSEGESLLIPAHEDFVLRADHRERTLYVHVPGELLTLNK